ncbi:MAG: BamA/TamA family outer membrane protein [Verrucomicrobiota bacterium]
MLAVLCLFGPVRAEELVQIEGLQSLDEAQARKWIDSQLTFINSSGVSMARADDVAYFLENAMRQRGYREATVDWKLEGEGEAGRIRLTVSEGSASTIGRFEISGNEALERDAVIELLTEATRKRLGLKANDPVPYVESDLKAGAGKVKQFYELLGYNETEVVTNRVTSESGAVVLVEIDEGAQKIVSEVLLPTATSIAMEDTFAELKDEFEDRNLNAALVSNLTSRLRSIAVNAGYYEAEVEVVEEQIGRGVSETGAEPEPAEEIGAELPGSGDVIQVQLLANLNWGDPVAVSGISVSGNEKVNPEFFDRHFGGLVGQPYSPGNTGEAVEELLETGAFETIRTDPVRQEDGSFHLDVEVEESYTRTLGIFGGATNYEGPIIGFEFRNLNLFGSVRTVDSEIEFSRRGARGEINYEDPWFLDTDVKFRAGLFGQNREEEGYEKWETGGGYEFTRRFGRKKRTAASLFGRASYTDVQDTEIDPALIGEQKYFVNLLGLSLTFDRRDDPAAPTKGLIASGSASVSSSGLGSEVEFLKTTGRIGYYHPVGKHRFRLAARAGTISPIGSTDEIPIDLRFFNGGPQTVRSFQERRLGPRDPMSGYWIGGEFYTVFNAEYEIPIEVLDGLSLVAFGDAGNLLGDADDASLDDLRYAVGLGLRYLTPIGPLRFEYGYNPDQRPYEPQGTFHVGFGFTY